MVIEKINTILSQMPPNWMSRVNARSGQVGNPEAELRKLLGEPLPQILHLRDLPRDLQALFGMYGKLQNIKKKLEWISRRKGGNIVPAKNTIACIDAEDNLYMGIDFLEKHQDDDDLVAGIMAHEWGHLMSELVPGQDLSHLSWDELIDVRKEEESAADAFAGRALFQMGYEVDQMVVFLENLEKIEKNVKTQKYYDAATRAAILKGAYLAQKNALRQLQKLFGERSKIIDPSKSRLIAVA